MPSIFYDKTHSAWVVKYTHPETGKPARKQLSKAEPPADPRIIPDHIRALAARYDDRPATASPASPSNAIYPPINLDQRLSQFQATQEQVLRPGSVKWLQMTVSDFRRYCRDNGIHWLHQVRPAVVRDFANSEIARRQMQPHSFKARLSLLGKLFSEAIEYEEIAGPNPIRMVCKRLKRSDTENAPPKVLTTAEIAALMAEIARRKARVNISGPSCRLPQWVEDIIVVMLNTGIRVDATIHMRFDWVEPGKITIPKEWSKSKRQYSTILNDKVQAIIARRREELGSHQPRVFPEINASQWLYARMKNLAKALIKRGEWTEDKKHYNHILRHTFITESLNRGVPLVHVARIAGHTTVACTQRYDQSTFDQAIAAAAMVSI